MSSDTVRALTIGSMRQVAVGDAASTRTVYAIVIALAAIGITLVIVAAWLIRQTRPDPELLAPLERMDDRSWLKQDPAQKRRSLDDARPAGAKPVVREKGVPEVDEEFGQAKPLVASFDDLQAQQDAERRRAAGDDPLLRSTAMSQDTDTDTDTDTDADAEVDADTDAESSADFDDDDTQATDVEAVDAVEAVAGSADDTGEVDADDLLGAGESIDDR